MCGVSVFNLFDDAQVALATYRVDQHEPPYGKYTYAMATVRLCGWVGEPRRGRDRWLDILHLHLALLRAICPMGSGRPVLQGFHQSSLGIVIYYSI